MIHQEFLVYIKSQLERGVPRTEISKALLDKGWSQDLVIQSFIAVDSANNKTKRSLKFIPIIIIFILVAIISVVLYKSATGQLLLLKNNLSFDQNNMQQSDKSPDDNTSHEQLVLSAGDASLINDVAEVLNAYERYYTNNQKYPWNEFSSYSDINKPIFFDSSQSEFGLISSQSDDNVGLLIKSDELKQSFTQKEMFTNPGENGQNKFWTFNSPGTDLGNIYVCHIPKSIKIRSATEKLRCLKNTDSYTEISHTGEGNCNQLSPDSDKWDTPIFNGSQAMFRCVPENK